MCGLLQGGGRDVEIPPPSDETCSMLLLLGLHAYHDPSLLAQLARLLTHVLLRSSVLLHCPATLAEGTRRLSLVRKQSLNLRSVRTASIPARRHL